VIHRPQQKNSPAELQAAQQHFPVLNYTLDTERQFYQAVCKELKAMAAPSRGWNAVIGTTVENDVLEEFKRETEV